MSTNVLSIDRWQQRSCPGPVESLVAGCSCQSFPRQPIAADRRF